MPSSHHAALLASAQKDGWLVGRWRPAVRAALARIERSLPVSDRVAFATEKDELLEHLGDFPLHPDAYSIRIESTENGWGHPVMVLELLEVEVAHALTDHNLALYEDMWWLYDSCDHACLRLFRMDRFGRVLLLMTSDTMSSYMKYGMLAAMPAGKHPCGA